MALEEKIKPSREKCEYTSCYCEENVWCLCEFFRREDAAQLEDMFVVFISNENRTVPLWRQTSGRGGQPVVWDYHVVLLQARSSVVYDLDSELPFPCSLKRYSSEALRSERGIRPAYHRKLRVVPAHSFLLNFASDRSHMKNSDGSWKMPPPPYPPIHTTESRMNLDDFISMRPAYGWGRVFSLEEFLKTHLGGASPSSPSSPSS
ncbi:protein N-terminal glutamine amidohydrolase isoform X2 [Trematomus bernacchii]|uniref:protein N-terminal glutamine amidohydrolase isoform X2 n=1 Tax=Trematomus bernacchii TaxID=40690 RepID=UPI00146EAC61|nr:protein N-terminal glutamine amidohydrolase isoform X2 [Trematomus bernacchii]